MKEGIDVSAYQGDISWPDVAAAGKTFAIIRSGDGAYLDPYFERNIEGALVAGLEVSIYHYLRFRLDIFSQAAICRGQWNKAVSLGVQPATLPLTGHKTSGIFWLDYEDTDSAGVPDFRRRWSNNLLNQLGDLPLGIYTGTWWWAPYMGFYPRAGDLPLWIGQYGPFSGFFQSDPTASDFSPVLPPEWSDWAIWQYSSQGACAGINGFVDLNIAKEGEQEMDEATIRQIARDEAANLPLSSKAKAEVLQMAGWKLVRGSAPTVYIVTQEGKRPFPGTDREFAWLDLRWSDVINVGDEVLAAIPDAP